MTRQEKIQNITNDARSVLLKHKGSLSGMSIVITSYNLTNNLRNENFGFHFEKVGSVKVGDILERGYNVKQKVEYIIN